jgi:hypothetical protein
MLRPHVIVPHRLGLLDHESREDAGEPWAEVRKGNVSVSRAFARRRTP